MTCSTTNSSREGLPTAGAAIKRSSRSRSFTLSQWKDCPNRIDDHLIDNPSIIIFYPLKLFQGLLLCGTIFRNADLQERVLPVLLMVGCVLGFIPIIEFLGLRCINQKLTIGFVLQHS